MPREILTEWTTPAGSGFLTVMYFELGVSVATQRAAVDDLFDSCATSLDSNVSWLVQTSGRELDDATGTLTGAWTEATSQIGNGANSGNVVPDASQAMIRWTTGEIVNGRFLKGRTYIPGFAVAAVSEGNVLAANVTAINAGCTAFVASGAQGVIWHRPVANTGGETKQIDGGTLWTEFAVLRQRR